MDKRIVIVALGITGLLFFLIQGDFIQRDNNEKILNNFIVKEQSIININISDSVSTTTITRPQLAIDLGKWR